MNRPSLPDRSEGTSATPVSPLPPSSTKGKGAKIGGYTLRDRKRMSQDFGHRPANCWGSGPLPAPFCQGDVVELVREPNERLRGMTGPFFVVSYACSIDEGDGWYFRVDDGNVGSDRLHVVYAERSDWDTSCDWMAPFQLVHTTDPDGLAERDRVIAAGFGVETVPCPACRGTGTSTRYTTGHAGAPSATTAEAGR